MSLGKMVTRFFVLFFVIFTLLIIIFSSTKLRQLHNIYFCTIEFPIHNIINFHVFADFLPEAPENKNHWSITFKVWDERKYEQSLWNKKFRENTQPKAILFQNAHEIVLVPTIFLISLFFASPIPWRRKLFKILLGLLLFYIFMALYLSYRFEYTINKDSLSLDSIWHVIIWFFGLGGNTDPIYIVVFFIWLLLTIPELIKLPVINKLLKTHANK